MIRRVKDEPAAGIAEGGCAYGAGHPQPVFVAAAHFSNAVYVRRKTLVSELVRDS